MGWFLAAGLAAVVAGFSWWQARAARGRYAHLIGTETSTVATLRELAAAASGAAGQDSYREEVEVEGEVAAGPGGLLRSETGGTDCVWHRQRTTRRYRDSATDAQGHRTETEKEEVAADDRTSAPFVLHDGTGEVLVHPEVVVDAATKGRTVTRRGDGGSTLGWTVEEWVLTPGTRLFVSGEARERGGRLEIGAPEHGRMVLSTRSEEQLIRSEAGSARTAGIVAKGSGAAAVVLAVAGLVALL